MSVDRLRAAAQARHDRSVALVQQALDNLSQREGPLRVKDIYAETKRVDPKGLGVHPTTYRRNPDLEERVSKAVGRSSSFEKSLDFSSVSIKNLRPDRNLQRAFHRLKSKSVRELAIRVIVLEAEVIALREELAMHEDRLLQTPDDSTPEEDTGLP